MELSSKRGIWRLWVRVPRGVSLLFCFWPKKERLENGLGEGLSFLLSWSLYLGEEVYLVGCLVLPGVSETSRLFSCHSRVLLCRIYVIECCGRLLIFRLATLRFHSCYASSCLLIFIDGGKVVSAFAANLESTSPSMVNLVRLHMDLTISFHSLSVKHLPVKHLSVKQVIANLTTRTITG